MPPLSELVKELRNGPGRIGKRGGEVLDVLVALNRAATAKDIVLALNMPLNKNNKGSVRKHLKRLREETGLVDYDEESHLHSIPEDLDERIYRIREASGEFEAKKKQKERHGKDRLIEKYKKDLRNAVMNGKDLDEVPVPPELLASTVEKTKERAADQARQRESSNLTMKKLRKTRVPDDLRAPTSGSRRLTTGGPSSG